MKKDLTCYRCGEDFEYKDMTLVPLAVDYDDFEDVEMCKKCASYSEAQADYLYEQSKEEGSDLYKEQIENELMAL